MGRRTETTDYLKECIADALIELLQHHSVEKIKIQEITDLAKVGRMTYFRYFNSKTDVLLFRMLELWNQWAEKNPFPHGRQVQEQAHWFFSFCYSIRDLLEMLYRNNLHIVLLYSFIEYTSPVAAAEPLSRKGSYMKKYLSYGMFGIVEEWIQNQFHESPEELAKICISFF